MWRMPHVPTAGGMDWAQNNGYPVISDWKLDAGNFLGQNRKSFQVYCSNPSACSSGSQLTVNFWGTPQELNPAAVEANLVVYKSSIVAGVRTYTQLSFDHIVNGDEKYFRVNLGNMSIPAGETQEIQIYYKAGSNNSTYNISVTENNHSDINNWGGNYESVP